MSFIRKRFSQICLIISLFLIFYTFYKSEIHWNGTKRNFYFDYYIISIFLLIFSIISFFLSKKIKDYLIIVSFSVLTSLYSFETYLLFLEHKSKINNNFEVYKKETGKEYDQRSKIQIYNDLKKTDENIKLMVYPSTYFEKKEIDLFPLSNISNSKTIYCNENGYYSIYESDRYGFNNPDKEWDQKEIEYMLIGDSFVHGGCVNRPYDIASVLRNLSNKSVLNLGFGDNGPLLEFATLREFLEPSVKKILWVYYEGNDLLKIKDKLSNKIIAKYLTDQSFSQNLKGKQETTNIMHEKLIDEKINNDLKVYTENQFKANLIRVVKIYHFRKLFSSQQEPELVPEFKKIIELANNLAAKNNSKLYFVYLPDYSRYKNNYEFKNHSKIKSIINELGIPFIDIDLQVFQKESDPLELFPFRQHGHYTVEGYRAVAEKIFELTQ